MICLFPLCTVHAESNGYCFHHAIYANSVAVKMPKPVKKESSSMKEVKKELKKLYPLFLAKHPLCNIKSPVCTRVATCINHTKGRGCNVLNVEDFESSCTACNLFIEENHEWARIRNHKKPRHNKS